MGGSSRENALFTRLIWDPAGEQSSPSLMKRFTERASPFRTARPWHRGGRKSPDGDRKGHEAGAGPVRRHSSPARTGGHLPLLLRALRHGPQTTVVWLFVFLQGVSQSLPPSSPQRVDSQGVAARLVLSCDLSRVGLVLCPSRGDNSKDHTGHVHGRSGQVWALRTPSALEGRARWEHG